MSTDNLRYAYLAPTATASSGAVNYQAPDLTRHPPRSPRTRLGGFVHLPRLIDKARAIAAGRGGDYHYPCPFDQRFFAFTGLDPEALLAEISAGRSDAEILSYVLSHARPRRAPEEIVAWSAWMEQLTPETDDSRTFFAEVLAKNAPHRTDILSWFDWLELDDHVSFGGRPQSHTSRFRENCHGYRIELKQLCWFQSVPAEATGPTTVPV